MTDYHIPTVVQPAIPVADMTALEQLTLCRIFDFDQQDGAVYLHSPCGPADVVTIVAGDLRAAFQAMDGQAGCIVAYVASLLERHDGTDATSLAGKIDLDLSVPGCGWDLILQDIVRRSATLDEIVVTAAFTCTKMRPDGFGGSVMLITDDAIRYSSTVDALEELRIVAAQARAARAASVPIERV